MSQFFQQTEDISSSGPSNGHAIDVCALWDRKWFGQPKPRQSVRAKKSRKRRNGTPLVSSRFAPFWHCTDETNAVCERQCCAESYSFFSLSFLLPHFASSSSSPSSLSSGRRFFLEDARSRKDEKREGKERRNGPQRRDEREQPVQKGHEGRERRASGSAGLHQGTVEKQSVSDFVDRQTGQRLVGNQEGRSLNMTMMDGMGMAVPSPRKISNSREGSSFSSSQETHGSSVQEESESCIQTREETVIQELPGIGTWAGRQRLFAKPTVLLRSSPSLSGHYERDRPRKEVRQESLNIEDSDHVRSNVFLPDNTQASKKLSEEMMEGTHRNGLPRLRSDSGQDLHHCLYDQQDGNRHSTQEDKIKQNDSVIHLEADASHGPSSADQHHAAWRWRFTRKWQAEQRRALIGGLPQSADTNDDVTDMEALQYAQACGCGAGLQFDNPSHHRHQRSRRRRRSQHSSRRDSKIVGAISESHPSEHPEVHMTTGSLQHLSCRGNSGYDSALLDYASSTSESCQFEVDQSYNSRNDGERLGRVAAEEDSDSNTVFDTPSGPLSVTVTGAMNGAKTRSTGESRNGSFVATKELMSVAGKAQRLLDLQKNIEKAASDTWSRSSNVEAPWAGIFLPPVGIDMFGRFTFAVLRISETRNGSSVRHQRMILRGRRGLELQSLISKTLDDIRKIAIVHSLPLPSVEVVGCGIMEWRSDTERHLMVSPLPNVLRHDIASRDKLEGMASTLNKAFDNPKPFSRIFSENVAFEDVSGLAASLVRQALPCHFSVSCLSRGRSSVMDSSLTVGV